MASKKKIDGNDLLYRFFQKLLETDTEVAVVATKLMIRSTAVWFATETFQRLPILLPWVIRDANCRSKTTKSGKTPEEWGKPDARGFLRDDNSLIKAIPRSLQVSGPPGSPVDKAFVEKGFVACHVWREVNLEELASRDPRLNSFVPNLVWLPSQVAKLSDIEGGLVQNALKATSWNLYRETSFDEPLRSSVEGVWSLLPEPPDSELAVPSSELNFFTPTDAFYERRKRTFHDYISFIYSVMKDEPLSEKRVTGRYFAHLHEVDKAELIKTLAYVRSHTSEDYLPE